MKIAGKRYDRATRKTKEANEACHVAERHLEKMCEYLTDSERMLIQAEDNLEDILNAL